MLWNLVPAHTPRTPDHIHQILDPINRSAGRHRHLNLRNSRDKIGDAVLPHSALDSNAAGRHHSSNYTRPRSNFCTSNIPVAEINGFVLALSPRQMQQSIAAQALLGPRKARRTRSSPHPSRMKHSALTYSCALMAAYLRNGRL